MSSLQQEIINRTTSCHNFTPIEDVFYYDDSAFFENCPLCNSEKGESSFTYVSKYRL
jgi:hypothetical protein